MYNMALKLSRYFYLLIFIYSSWDIECNTLKSAIMGHFLPFTLPPKNQKKQNFEKMKILPRDIIILHKCTKNHSHMRYSSWDMEWDRQTFLSFWVIFYLYTTLTTRKNTILKQWKKHLEMSSLYTYVPKITSIWCMLPEIWNVTDIIFCHFGPFCHFDPKNKNLE